jgi:hypothetical protein
MGELRLIGVLIIGETIDGLRTDEMTTKIQLHFQD